MNRSIIFGSLFLWACVGPSLAHAEDARIPVAVSYFDNTSNDAALDALRKGIAEMLITDLSVSSQIQLTLPSVIRGNGMEGS